MATDDNTFKKLGTEETVHSSGAQRDTRIGKGAFHWLPWTSVFLVSRIYENGNRMRGVRNWEKGMPLEQYLDSALRHITRHLAGDRSEPHIPQAIWNLLNYTQTAIWVKMGLRPKELNDLPDHFTGKEPGTIDPLSRHEIEWLPAWGIDLTPITPETQPAGVTKLTATLAAIKPAITARVVEEDDDFSSRGDVRDSAPVESKR